MLGGNDYGHVHAALGAGWVGGARPAGVRGGARPHQPGAVAGAGEVVLRRRPVHLRGRPGVLHRHDHRRRAVRRRQRRALRRPGRRPPSHQVGDHRDAPPRPPDLRDGRRRRRPRLAHHQQRPSGGLLRHRRALRHPALLQPEHGRGEQRRRGERHRQAVARARFLPRRLVAEPGHLLHRVGPAGQHQLPVRAAGLQRDRPRSSRASRATSTSPTRSTSSRRC
jgi:hypothetical protein